jgi:xanthine dehydrogenase iron-sulfur cluster and FAD-binding subunit A
MLDEDFTPITDMRSTAQYRSEVCRNLLTRFLNETTGTDTASVYSYGR